MPSGWTTHRNNNSPPGTHLRLITLMLPTRNAVGKTRGERDYGNRTGAHTSNHYRRYRAQMSIV